MNRRCPVSEISELEDRSTRERDHTLASYLMPWPSSATGSKWPGHLRSATGRARASCVELQDRGCCCQQLQRGGCCYHIEVSIPNCGRWNRIVCAGIYLWSVRLVRPIFVVVDVVSVAARSLHETRSTCFSLQLNRYSKYKVLAALP
jgi:hypothetical protein